MVLHDVVDAYTNRTLHLTILSLITFAGGYALFIYSILLTIREKKLPFPLWVYTLWVAHDFSGAVVLFEQAQKLDWFWFFTTTSIALLIWNFLELSNICLAIKHARQDIWGKFYDKPVTTTQAIGWVIAEIMVMFAVVNLLRSLMEDNSMFKWFVLSNVPLVLGPAYLWTQRKNRDGASVGLAILIVLIMLNQILPPGVGNATTASSFFDQPWFYISGAIFLALALRNLTLLLSYPPKIGSSGRKPIW